MADTPIRLSEESQRKLLQYCLTIFDYQSTHRWGIRENLLERDLMFYRENDWTKAHERAQAANKSGDASRLQNVQVPIVMPQVESQLADLASIFLTGYPIFGVASSPANVDRATALETQIADNAIRFGWVRQLLLGLRDGLKYNVQAVEVDWADIKTGSVLNDVDATQGEGAASQIIYSGNRINRLDMYNTVLDPRVAPAECHTEGEFAGYTKLVSRISLKRELVNLPKGSLMNATKAFESGNADITNSPGTLGYYIPTINQYALIDPSIHQHDWLTWLGLEQHTKIKYSASYEKSVLYARLIPSEFGITVPNSPNTPRIFKIVLINRKVIVYAQIMTNAHDYLPIVAGQPEEDGLGWQTKSFAQTVEPYQQLATGLWASVMEGQRRSVYDRLLYDPDRVRKEDINKADSVGRIPVRPKQYSKSVADGVMALPYRMENQQGVMGLIQQLGTMADEAGGSNKASRGQFQKGNRTRFEYEDTMGGNAGRTRTRALALEYQFFMPIKEIIKLNALQYQAPAEFTDQRTGDTVMVNPVELRKLRLDFKMSDGLLPTAKLISGDLIDKIAQFGMAVPSINAEYDIMGMLQYNWKQSGASWLPDFKRTPEQQAQQMALMQQAAAKPGEPGNPNQPQGVSNGTSPAQ